MQMCMSTTGFGTDARVGRQRPEFNPPSPPTVNSMSGETSYSRLGVSQLQNPQQEVLVKSRRPPPKFDMNLRDLFPDDINHDGLASQAYMQQRQPQVLHQQSQRDPMQPPRPSQEYSLPQQQECRDNQIDARLGLSADQSSPSLMAQYPALPQQQQQMQQALPTTSNLYNTNPYDVDLTNVSGLDFLQSTDFNQNLDTAGIDLGLGPGIDFQHDWSDGTGVDIFDGYFFGNAAG